GLPTDTQDEAAPGRFGDRRRPYWDGPRADARHQRVRRQHQREPHGEPRYGVRNAAAGVRQLALPRQARNRAEAPGGNEQSQHSSQAHRAAYGAHRHAALLDRCRMPRPEWDRLGAVGLLRDPWNRHRRGFHAQLSGRAHRRTDVLRADDRERAEPHPRRPPAGGIHGILRLAQSRCHSRAGKIVVDGCAVRLQAARGLKPQGAAKMPPPKIGTRVKDFTLSASGGGTWGLKNAAGRKLVLYFYPKDMTSGCTRESQDFRDLHAAFRKAGTMVVGVSRDSVRSHDRFTDKEKLPFPL